MFMLFYITSRVNLKSSGTSQVDTTGDINLDDGLNAHSREKRR